VVEDYVHGKVKIVTLLLLNFIHFALAAVGIFSVLRIAFGVAA
jgi:succinate dehydrogenase / fumarate reductase membrane anchor subunit